ncbi:MAG TPA: hypothetical protein VFJ13_03625 [Paracoccaceae bacterium]|nr:hypothetical protein [Paracoccaceae bacterium]
MSASRRKGTRWETAIADFLRANGFPGAERRALAGAADRGDIAGVPEVCIEAKCARAIELASWADEARAEAANAGAGIAAVWVHRRGRSSPADGYVVLDGATFAAMLRRMR